MELSNKKQYEENQNIYQSVEHIISKLNYENIENLVISTLEFFDENFPNSFHLLIYQIIFSHCFLPKRDPCLYINYLKNLETKEEELLKSKYQIIKGFKEFLLIENSYSQESYYILEKMIEDKLIDSNFPKNTLYFAHFMTKDEIYHYTNLDIASQFFQNYEELTKNDFKLHKKYVKEGVNPNEIAKIIRNDEIEKLQEISSQSNFDFNQIIEPSLYERCDFINQRNVSLIDYAAFFSSIKCFKYLLVNGAKVENTGKYAVAGGNEEIIHLCEQNHSSFEDAYETAIEFRRNDVFEYLYENKIIKIDDIEELGKKAICFCNFEILSLLEYKGMKITENIIKEAASYGNIFLVNFFLKKNQIPKDILLSVITFNYVELVEFLIKQKGIDINAKDIYLFYLIFI